MGAISDWTENLANEITSLREGRAELLDQLRTETNNLLDNFKGGRRVAARRDEEQRKVTVSEIFSNSRGMVERFRMERQEMERELCSELASVRDDLGKARQIWEDLTKKKIAR